MKKILYIEDDSINIEIMEMLFDSVDDYILLCSKTAEEGLSVAQSEQPDLILMDIELPGMNGFEAMEHLKAEQNTAHIPVVALSADDLPQYVKKAKNVGFKYYIVKPFNFELFFEKIDLYV